MNKGVIALCLLLVGNTNAQEPPEFRISAYCPCSICCGRYSDGFTATGKRAEGRIIAVDPKVIPLHTRVEIDGLGYFYAEDTGSAIKGNRIDVLFANHNDALEFGVQYRKVRC